MSKLKEIWVKTGAVGQVGTYNIIDVLSSANGIKVFKYANMGNPTPTTNKIINITITGNWDVQNGVLYPVSILRFNMLGVDGSNHQADAKEEATVKAISSTSSNFDWTDIEDTGDADKVYTNLGLGQYTLPDGITPGATTYLTNARITVQATIQPHQCLTIEYNDYTITYSEVQSS